MPAVYMNNSKSKIKVRADKLLVIQGLAENRNKAKALIMAGLVKASGKKVEKAGDFIDRDTNLSLKQTIPYVGRGGLKLEKDLDAFELDIKGWTVLDLGASTGGFTDCLLQKGAEKIYALDVDTRQMDWRLRNDPRVILINKNARYIEREDFDSRIQLVTMDLSFISILKVFPSVMNVATKAEIISLIKPQFEAGRSQVGKNGVIRDPYVHEEVLNRVVEKILKLGFKVHGLTESPVRGQKGNREFFALCSDKESDINLDKLKKLIKEAVWNEKD
jgi:23S rRNA (cytidine1920-2'-O)/16S rRNA (cytidine1409-2'-O)-methyltransferase